MKKYLLPNGGQFYKANLHCHTTVSDGELTPCEVKELYKSKGYSVIAYTDHDIMIPHPELADDTFLPLTGYEMEINDMTPGRPWHHNKCCHMCLIALEPEAPNQVCWHRGNYLFRNAPQYADQAKFDPNEPDYERVYSPACINDMVRRGREGGFFMTYNHPAWSLEDFGDFGQYENFHAMEIVNYGCFVDGYNDYNGAAYDALLRQGKHLYCIAADDNHDEQHACGGWTMIKADKLDYRTITKALEAGHFYASMGPEIHDLWFEDGRIHITCSPAKRIICTYGCRRGGAVNAGDTLLTEASFPVEEDSIFVRITVWDEHGMPADTNAFFVEDLLK